MGLVVVLVMGAALILLPRRYTIFPMIIVACFIPSAQRLAVAGLDFTLLRILVLFAWTRLLLRNEFKHFTWNRLDSMVLAWMVSGTTIYTIQNGTLQAFIFRAGWMFDGLGMYFFFRCVLADWEDMDRLIVAFAVISIPVAVAFLVESQTARNVFSIFGGVPPVTVVRDGKLRCQGAFAHPILAGCYWASVMPWMIASFLNGRLWLAALGIASSFLIVVTSASSTPVLAVACVILGISLYPLRHHVRSIRWAFFASLVVLHLVMKNPVWHLLARIDIFSGSTGWHRYKIIDATVNNFSKWWLIGENDVLSWGVWQMQDVTNQYILEALRGGLLTLVLFVVGIGVAFGLVGRALHQVENVPHKRILVWAIGASLFVQVSIYFAVSYFGQIIMLWYLNLAMAGSLSTLLQDFDERIPTTVKESPQ